MDIWQCGTDVSGRPCCVLKSSDHFLNSACVSLMVGGSTCTCFKLWYISLISATVITIMGDSVFRKAHAQNAFVENNNASARSFIGHWFSRSTVTLHTIAASTAYPPHRSSILYHQHRHRHHPPHKTRHRHRHHHHHRHHQRHRDLPLDQHSLSFA